MCGFTGIFDTQGERVIDKMLLEKINESQHHRGPDEGGLHIEPGLGMGHRRLSIIDLSSGQQPLFNEDNSIVVVFNGEIYNFESLMAELKESGHTFRTHCDTEVIVHAWEQWGEACVQRFQGMFAFSLWDRKQKTLFLERDHLGIKPLHYSLLADGMFIFGSELKSLCAHPAVPREIDPRSVEDYFAYGYVPEPKTIYKNVYKLSPGHTITLKMGMTTIQQNKYWDIPFTSNPHATESNIEVDLISRLRDGVKSQMIADVPLGAFLSGGVDSSAIVAMMAGLKKEPVTTCSIGFDNPEYDESQYAAKIAAQFNTQHHSEIVSADDYDLIDTLAALYDEPYADSSAIPTYRVCELAKKHVTVVLSGDGGDENFAGYRRYRFAMAEHRIRAWIPLSIRKPLFGLLGAIYPKADWAPRVFRAKTTFESLSRDLVDGYFHSVSTLNDRVRNQLFSDQFRQRLQGYRAVEVMRNHAKHSPTTDPLSTLQYIDLKTYLPGDILTKVDRASMAHSLEVRVPLLDHKFVEWVSGLPSTLKLKEGEGKYIFKKSLKPLLDQDILYRQKRGFSIPLAEWLRGPLREKMRAAILNPLLLETGIFNKNYLLKMIDEHQSGVKDHSVSLWSVLMFEAFLRVNSSRN
jgi:asparagine synthase (glutamine-hydrolysing)